MNKETSKKIKEMLNPTDEQKERMLADIIAKYENASAEHAAAAFVSENAASRETRTEYAKCASDAGIHRRTRRFKFRYAAVLAAALFLITGTAFASDFLGLNAKFLEFLHPQNEAQGEYLASGACAVNKQIKTKYGTLDIKEAIGDSNYTLIFMEFTAPEGTVLDKAHYTFDTMNVDFGKNSWVGYGVHSLPDDDPTDNKIDMVMNLRTENTLAGKKLYIYFKDLAASDTYPGEKYKVMGGEWEGSFKLGFKNCSADYQLNETVDMFGYDAVLKNLSVSPISVTLKLESSFSHEIADASGEWNYDLKLAEDSFDKDRFPITINYLDGTSETTDLFDGTSKIDHLGGQMIFIKTFDNLINDKEIKSVTFFGTEILI